MRATTNPGDIVMDPFAGSGTTGVAALQTGRRFIGIERNEEYTQIAKRRMDDVYLSLVSRGSGARYSIA